MQSRHFALIMAGGAGTRFWPLSTEKHPKQFMDVLGTGKSLLQQTFDRIRPLFPVENIFVITAKKYRDLVSQHLPELPAQNILLEEARKNTAPGITYAAFKIKKICSDAVMLITPSDHLIKKEKVFRRAISSCLKKAGESNMLITIGIRPTRPDTGYGYIQYIPDSNVYEDSRLYKVKTFTEKPDLPMANFFLESGDFLWNSGIFIWKAETILEEIKKHEPDLYQLFLEASNYIGTGQEQEKADLAFIRCKNISIDYAVMEKAQNVLVRSSGIGWSDIGTWQSIAAHIPQDEYHNACVGKNILLYDSTNNVVHADSNKLVVLQGIHDCIVVEKDNMILICRKEDEQHIRSIVNDIRIKKGEKFI